MDLDGLLFGSECLEETYSSVWMQKSYTSICRDQCGCYVSRMTYITLLKLDEEIPKITMFEQKYISKPSSVVPMPNLQRVYESCQAKHRHRLTHLPWARERWKFLGLHLGWPTGSLVAKMPKCYWTTRSTCLSTRSIRSKTVLFSSETIQLTSAVARRWNTILCIPNAPRVKYIPRFTKDFSHPRR